MYFNKVRLKNQASEQLLRNTCMPDFNQSNQLVRTFAEVELEYEREINSGQKANIYTSQRYLAVSGSQMLNVNGLNLIKQAESDN